MIHINQAGYLPKGTKKAVITKSVDAFSIFDSSTGQKVYGNNVTGGEYDEMSGDNVYYADFTEFDKPGKYYIGTDIGEKSYNFKIENGVYKAVKNDMIKALYFQRCGCALDEKHAGVYKHGKCHAEKAVFLNDRETDLDMTGGWHDAGDYGRYTTPAANTIGHLLYAFELFPKAFREELNIPESGNGVPDILNECRYELEWLFKMQDKKSGGVYHKLTTYTHAAFVMPEEDRDQMLIFPMSSMAAGDFAACMALAYRIYKKYDAEFAERMLDASKLAWEWLDNNPGFLPAPENPPGGNTGGYGDRSDIDERFWAAAELYRATGDKKYDDKLTELFKTEDFYKMGFGWGNVAGLGVLSYLFNRDFATDHIVSEKLLKEFIEKADDLYDIYEKDKYGTSLAQAREYGWGSNMTVANNGIHLIAAKLLTGNKKYEIAAAAQLDYLLGKNAMGISYITGHGENAYKYPHLRTTYADGIDDPIPGWVSGGPNFRPNDPLAKKLIKEGTPPAKCYADRWECYSLNEITIYWNSPAIFVAAYFDSLD